MKIILSIFLSVSLLASGISMPEPAEAETRPEVATETLQEETDLPETEPTAPKKETGKKEKEEDTQGAEEIGAQKDASSPTEKEKPIEKEEGTIKKEMQEPSKTTDSKIKKPTETKKQPLKKQKELSEDIRQKDTDATKQNTTSEPLELESLQRQAAPIKEIIQDTDTKKLVLERGEQVLVLEKTGYHMERTKTFRCRHTADNIKASVLCRKAPNGLNPTENDLLNGVKLTGKLRGKRYTASVRNTDAGGTDNTVTHLALDVEIKAPGADGGNIKTGIAGPYVCVGDGYAGYAYFEAHYSYCPNTDRFYNVASSHVWLGCKKDPNGGTPEFHPVPFTHEFGVFKYVPNSYTITYNVNGGAGNPSNQNATYDRNITLRSGSMVTREGYTLTGWNTKANGTGSAYRLSEETKNLTARNGGRVTLYAQWKINTLTVQYNANGGSANAAEAANNIRLFTNNWNYKTANQDPANFSSFKLSRLGYSRKAGAEWNTKADGTGRSFDQDKEYAMTYYAPDLKTGSRTITLYAQWKPDIYTITLDNQLAEPFVAGTEKLYKQYEHGIFFDNECTNEITPTKERIIVPKKDGYKFKGYYSMKAPIGDSSNKKWEKMMIDAEGRLTEENNNGAIIFSSGNDTWYAWYDYLIECEDYADIPCDIAKTPGDVREDLGMQLTFNSSTRKTSVTTSQTGCSVSLTGMPSGTEIGEFKSSISGSSASGNTWGTKSAEFSLIPQENAAYHLKISKGAQTFYDRLVYYKDGRFRTLAKLGVQEPKDTPLGSSLSGSAWGVGEAYDLYQYHGCSSLTNIKKPGTVQRYFRYKDVNMAYSGNGATAGTNMLEYDVSLEDMYQFRDNNFTKETTERKMADGKAYECQVKYGFEGWKLTNYKLFKEKAINQTSQIYKIAENEGVLSNQTTEDIFTYQKADPLCCNNTILAQNLYGSSTTAQHKLSSTTTIQAAGLSNNAHATEYINLEAKWNAFPTIVVVPGDKLEYYEGEKVTKTDLIQHLLAHDAEDNRNEEVHPNLNNKLRVIKLSYPASKNHSQGAYEKTYPEDVPEDFLLDTYYLKLEKDENVDVLITFAVTDSAGNTTEEEIPVKVKYNNYPEINSEDTFYYLKEEANRGEITAETLLGRASATDVEDGDLTGKLSLKDFDPQTLKMQTQSKEEFDVTYQVTDAYNKTTYRTVKLMVWDEQAVIAEMPKYYVRYISENYLDTLEENSSWRQPENFAYLKNILKNETPMETWEFTRADVLAIQEWITEDGNGNWKLGQEANQAFLAKFAHCKK